MDSGLGAPGPEVLLAQLTVKTGGAWSVMVSAQGRSVRSQSIGSDWNVDGIKFAFDPSAV